MIEAMAQLLGWLIIFSHDFRLSPIMSLLEEVTVTPHLRPGFKAEIHGEMVSSSKRDSLGKARMYVDGKVIASVDRMIYSHIYTDHREDLIQLFRYYSGLDRIDPPVALRQTRRETLPKAFVMRVLLESNRLWRTSPRVKSCNLSQRPRRVCFGDLFATLR